jgi:hypothetical protein
MIWPLFDDTKRKVEVRYVEVFGKFGSCQRSFYRERECLGFRGATEYDRNVVM